MTVRQFLQQMKYTAILTTLVVGTAAAGALGLIDFSNFHVALARPVFTMPATLFAFLAVVLPWATSSN